MYPSKQYEEYERNAGWSFCGTDMERKIDYPVNIQCLYFMKTKRKVDLVNLLEATDDILTKYGILADDNHTIVAAHDGSRVYYDKDDPRVEITITKLPKLETEQS